MRWHWLAGVGVIAGIGAAGLWLLKRLKERGGTQIPKDAWEENSTGNQKSYSRDAPDCAAQETKPCKEELEQFGSRFADLYEPLRQVAQKTGFQVDEGDLAFSWEARLEEDERVRHLYQKWQTLQEYSEGERIEKWYYFLLSLGMAYSTEQSVIFSEETLKKYDFVDDWKAYIGQTLQVKKGYWYLGDAILEKGNLNVCAAVGGVSGGAKAQEV